MLEDTWTFVRVHCYSCLPLEHVCLLMNSLLVSTGSPVRDSRDQNHVERLPASIHPSLRPQGGAHADVRFCSIHTKWDILEPEKFC